MRITKTEKNKLVQNLATSLRKRTTSVITKGERRGGDTHYEVEPDYVSISKYLRGGILGNWENAQVEQRLYKTLGADSGTAGGFLIPEVLSSNVIELLKDESVIRRMPGVRTVPVPHGKLKYAAVDDGPEISWGSENTTISEDTTLSFGQKTLECKKAVCLYKMSRELIDAAGPAADDIVRTELAAEIALEEDKVFLEGTGGTKPLGIYYNPSVQSTDLSGDIGFDDILEANYKLRAVSSKLTGFVTSPVVEYKLEKLKDSSGNYLLGSQQSDRYSTIDLRTLYGRPLGITNEIGITNRPGSDETYLVAANWRDFIIGDGLGGLRIETSMHSYDAFYKDQVHMRVVKHVGSLLRHNESFVVIRGITAS